MASVEAIDDLSPEGLARFDAIIDVRSPAEFAEDRIPEAVNLPVLDNEERARVGTIYVQESPFLARRMGGALVARNIASHLETALADRPPGFQPLVYCWRGGLRSRAMALVLSSVGWRTGVVTDGYKRWRREVVQGLQTEAGPLPIVLVDGQTGAGKTRILIEAARQGAQALDLEGLAAHRGSAFGAFASMPQPSQKAFDSRVWDALRRFDPSRPILVEAESARVGRLRIPPRLWAAMKAAPRIEIVASADARANHVVREYADVSGDADVLRNAIERLRPSHPRERIETWLALAGEGKFQDLAHSLIVHHYDPVYDRSRQRQGGSAPGRLIAVDRLDPDGIEKAAAQLAALAEPKWRPMRAASA